MTLHCRRLENGLLALRLSFSLSAKENEEIATSFARPIVGFQCAGVPSTCSPAAGGLQPEVLINQPGDVDEEEADRISEQVVNTSAPQNQRSSACAGDLGGPTEQLGQQVSGCRLSMLG